MQFQLPKINYDDFDTFFLHLFIYLSKFRYADKNSKITKAGNLKLGDIKSLQMKLGTCSIGGATLRGLGQTQSKLVTAK